MDKKPSKGFKPFEGSLLRNKFHPFQNCLKYLVKAIYHILKLWQAFLTSSYLNSILHDQNSPHIYRSPLAAHD